MFGWSRPPETHTDLRRSIVTGAMISRNVFLTTTRGQLADRKSCDTPLVFGCAMAPPTQTLYGGGSWSQVGADGLRSGCLAGGTEQEDGLHNAPLWSTPFRHLTRGEAWAPRDPQNQLHKGSAGPPGGCAEPPKGWPPMGTAEPPVGSAVSRPRPAFDEASSAALRTRTLGIGLATAAKQRTHRSGLLDPPLPVASSPLMRRCRGSFVSPAGTGRAAGPHEVPLGPARQAARSLVRIHARSGRPRREERPPPIRPPLQNCPLQPPDKACQRAPGLDALASVARTSPTPHMT